MTRSGRPVLPAALLGLWLAALLVAQEPPRPLDRARLASLRKTLLDARAPLKEREAAAAALAADPEGGLLLVSLAGDGKLPREVEPAAAGAIFANPDFGVRALASRHFKTPARDKLPPVAEILKLPGDAARGRKVFFGASSGCSKCHVFAGEGGDVGPNLTELRSKIARPEILDAILNPSAAIAFGFEAWLIVTKDDEVYSGFILGDGDEVALKESSGENRFIAADRIRARKKQEISLMPDNLAVGMTPQELRDLVEFLATEPKK